MEYKKFKTIYKIKKEMAYNKNDMRSFGEWLLSPERKKLIKSLTPQPMIKIVHDIDFEHYEAYKKNKLIEKCRKYYQKKKEQKKNA